VSTAVICRQAVDTTVSTTLTLVVANRPPRLDVFQRYDLPWFFVTLNTHKRRHLLPNERVHDSFIRYCEKGLSLGAGVGRYVLMPDQIHLFVRLSPDLSLAQWIRNLKPSISASILEKAPHWRDFLIIYCGAKIPIRKSGNTSDKTQ
jgi:REP element-mobilizing transposase RayT